jgi:pyrimidine operon attenuation protein/uracil phosphoribosyltransferase
MSEEKRILFEGEDLGRTISRMAHEVLEKASNPSELVLIGIRSRGVHLARRMMRRIHEIAKITPPLGIIDVTRYRDDRPHEQNPTGMGPLEIPASVDEKTVVLIDDVIFRGRTIRAAMEAVARLGQPKRIFVAVLVDRGARELPIRADIVGKNVAAAEDERINVMLQESDGIDQITLGRWQNRGAV